MAAGLREQKKDELRDRLSLATVVLARERGLANVRVEDIVGMSGVSRRTFSNYFASKEEAIADRHVQRTREAAQALGLIPAEQPLWAAIIAVIVDPYAQEPIATSAQPKADQDGLISVLGEPEMRAAIMRGSQTAIGIFASAVADRIGVDVDTDIRPRLIANAALTTQLLTIDFWLRSNPPGELILLLRDAFGQLGSGFDASLEAGHSGEGNF